MIEEVASFVLRVSAKTIESLCGMALESVELLAAKFVCDLFEVLRGFFLLFANLYFLHILRAIARAMVINYY